LVVREGAGDSAPEALHKIAEQPQNVGAVLHLDHERNGVVINQRNLELCSQQRTPPL
jgi:hypothetical protein